MIALSRTIPLVQDAESVQERFLDGAADPSASLLAFRSLRSEAREESVQEVIALAYSAFVRLVRQGKVALAFATTLARYAIRQVRAGRRLGCRQNVHDIMSPVRDYRETDDSTARSVSRANRGIKPALV